MALFLKMVIWGLFIFAAYHLIRDLLQDVLKIHHPIIDTFHLRPIHREHFLGRYFRYWGIPLETGIFVLSFKSIQDNHFGLIGSLAIGLFATFISFWAWSSFR